MMRTQGLKVYRFRKRYYVFYSRDSCLSGLGSWIVEGIPADPSEYRQWLDRMRKTAAGWHKRYESVISVTPGKHVAKSSDDNDSFDDNESLEDNFMEHQLPSFLAPMNSLFIEWVYIIDLDNEAFTVNHGAHFRLDQIPDHWIGSLARVPIREREVIVIPGSVPDESIASLVVDTPVFGTVTIAQRDFFSVSHSHFDSTIALTRIHLSTASISEIARNSKRDCCCPTHPATWCNIPSFIVQAASGTP